MSWIKHKNGGWKRPKVKKDISISIFFLLDHDVLLKVGGLVRDIKFKKSRKFYKSVNETVRRSYGGLIPGGVSHIPSKNAERYCRLHQDIQMYGICHSLLMCPIKQIKYDFMWTRTYALSTWWPTWLGIVDNIRILCESFHRDVITFAQTGNTIPPLLSEIIPIISGGFRREMRIGVSKIANMVTDEERLCIRDFREPRTFHPEHLLEFLKCDMSQLKGVQMNTIYTRGNC
jgi:hypothetical protein